MAVQVLNIFSEMKQSLSLSKKANINHHDNLRCDTKHAGDSRESIQLSKAEQMAIKQIENECKKIKQAIEGIETSMLTLENVKNKNEKLMTRCFDDIISFTKSQKNESMKQFNKIISDKQHKIMQQMNELTLYQAQMNKFKEKTIKIKQENVMNAQQINDFIVHRSETLISCDENNLIHSKQLIDTKIEIELNTKKTTEYFDKFCILNACKLPLPPQILMSDISHTSVKIKLNDRSCSDSEEYKIEMLKVSPCNDAESCTDYCWQQVAIVVSTEFVIMHLEQNTKYFVRCSCKNKFGFGPSSKAKKFETLKREKTVNETEQFQLIYLAPAQKYQNELMSIINEQNMETNETKKYFAKFGGFHITIGPKLEYNLKDENGECILHKNIIRELWELGLKNQCGKTPIKWKIRDAKVQKWKIGKTYFMVLTFDNFDRLLNVSSTYLRTRGWKNAKKKNWNLTISLNDDMNRAQINQIVEILTSCRLEWEWFAITQSQRSEKVEWESASYPVYEL